MRALVNSTSRGDWTTGPAKWAAVGALGATAVLGMVWAAFGRGPVRPSEPELPPPAVSTSEDAEVALATGDTKTESIEPEATPHSGDGEGEAVSPSDAAGAPAAKAESAPSTVATLIDLNSATAAELDLLPGIGPAIAARIIEDRTRNGPFKRLEDVGRVKGIGPKTIEKLRGKATVVAAAG